MSKAQVAGLSVGPTTLPTTGHDGKPLVGDGAIKLLLGFTPQDLSPGEYSLYVAVRDAQAASSTEVSVPLKIEPQTP